MWSNKIQLPRRKRRAPFMRGENNQEGYISWLPSSFPLSNAITRDEYRYEALVDPDLKRQQQGDNNQAASPHRTRLKSNCILVCLCLATNVSYLLSLRGAASPKEMAGILGRLATFLVAAVVFCTIQFWTSTLFVAIPRRWRWFNVALQFLLFGLWYLFDNGNTLDAHGAFNLLIFCVILVPLNTVLGSLYFWYIFSSSDAKKRPRRFCAQFFAALLTSALLIAYFASNKKAALNLGFFDKQIPCSAEQRSSSACRACQWKTAIPWFDLVPFRINFFTGPMTCPKEDSFSAFFNEQNKLVIECAAEITEAKSWLNGSIILTHTGAVYTTLPRTETWDFHLKHDSLGMDKNPLQRHVLGFAESHLRPYRGPTTIKDDTDTVLAFCGSAPFKIVNRFVPADSTDEKEGQTSSWQPTSPPVKLNVVTIFIDAVSRRQFHRRLPMTRQVIEDVVASPNSSTTLIEFSRYHKIGFNTGPNTRALWAGLNELDPNSSGTPLWEQYHAAGYKSARIDPMCQDWTAYYDPGHFANTSSDSLTPRLSNEYLAWSCFPPYLPIGKKASGNFAGPTSIKARCLSGTHAGWHELDWASSFIATPSSRPYYLNAAFMEGHEGSGEVLRTLDERLARFLHPATSPLDLANTAVELVSDHGALMGLNFAFLDNGKIEAANPMAIMLLPKSVTSRSGRAERLRAAAGKLVTAHDLYETTKGFMGLDLDLGSGLDEVDASASSSSLREKRGYDLLREALPDRSCAQAGIRDTPCMCV